jgi:hypothetical protein
LSIIACDEFDCTYATYSHFVSIVRRIRVHCNDRADPLRSISIRKNQFVYTLSLAVLTIKTTGIPSVVRFTLMPADVLHNDYPRPNAMSMITDQPTTTPQQQKQLQDTPEYWIYSTHVETHPSSSTNIQHNPNPYPYPKDEMAFDCREEWCHIIRFDAFFLSYREPYRQALLLPA